MERLRRDNPVRALISIHASARPCRVFFHEVFSTYLTYVTQKLEYKPTRLANTNTPDRRTWGNSFATVHCAVATLCNFYRLYFRLRCRWFDSPRTNLLRRQYTAARRIPVTAHRPVVLGRPAHRGPYQRHQIACSRPPYRWLVASSSHRDRRFRLGSERQRKLGLGCLLRNPTDCHSKLSKPARPANNPTNSFASGAPNAGAATSNQHPRPVPAVSQPASELRGRTRERTVKLCGYPRLQIRPCRTSGSGTRVFASKPDRRCQDASASLAVRCP